MNSVDEVLARLRALRANDVPTHGGRTLSYVYDSGLADADALGRHALADFGGTNGLDPTAFPSLLAMENDLVAFAGDLLDAESGFAGTVTSGGTESILLAVKAARDASAVVSPAMVLPATAHAAFHKAAHYFGVRPVVIDVDPVTFRADPDAMRAAVDDSTVLLVGSAPSYAHGVIDPIAAIAAIGADRGIRVHVDACIGGWVLPFLPDVAPWTFAVPGVTSISVDLHKYGYSPKGVSILLHRNAELRRSQFFATADWPGYTMLNTTIQSTKSGGPLAAAWAVATFLGREGYADLARTARQASLDVAAGVTGLRPLVAPDSTLLALVASDDFDVYTVADEMAARGWLVQPQLPYRGGPASLHLSLCAATAPLVPELLGALADSVAVARAAGPVALDPGLVAVVAALDPSGLDAAAFDGILAMAGMAGGAHIPERMAMINALLGEASSQLREALLLAFLDRLTRPERLS
ncbi:MAG TPA: aminotransferase class V-fold PLP-dependent enzyme [Tetrasphaera sp.]|uniref:pyridoxal phosphate-dependent decarboxylase family protein n=1 Tax=Nostocoides sp. TaxID=1917966 RepID=UPI002B927A31|nr:aminotransferase class V-fold PLP-dependent enzyme [Tetrasphaera sp.]HNQ06475.1 aminotransferase class V-fold PLP-dependent enzyme [Tetrasphaera sp.]